MEVVCLLNVRLMCSAVGVLDGIMRFYCVVLDCGFWLRSLGVSLVIDGVTVFNHSIVESSRKEWVDAFVV